MSLEGEEDDDKNADTFGDDAGGGEGGGGGFGDLSDLAKATAAHDAFLLENNARAGQRVGAAADDDAFNADWAGTGDDLTSLHKQFMAEYQTRALTDEGQSAAGRGGAHAHGSAAAAAAAAGGEDDADLSIKSVLRAIDDEDAVAPASHAQRVARQPLPSAVPLLPSTPLKAAAGAGGAAAGGVPATPPNPWAFSKPAGSPFVESFMSFSASPFKAAGAPAGAASAAQEAFNKGLAPPTPQRQALPQQPPPQQPQRPLLPPPPQQQQQPPPGMPQHGVPPQPSAAKKGAVMNVADFEASLRGGGAAAGGNHSAGPAPHHQPHGNNNNGGLPAALAHFIMPKPAGPGAGPQHPPPGMTSGQSFLAALNSGALQHQQQQQQQPMMPQRPGHIQLPPQHTHQPLPHPAMRGPGPQQQPQQQFGPGPMPFVAGPGGVLPQDPAIAGAMSPASPLTTTGALQPPPGTTAAEGNWYIPLPQRFSHTQMSKQEIAYVIRMQLKQLLPRPTLFLPAAGGNTDADSSGTTDRSNGAGGGGGGNHTPASPSLTPSKAHGDGAPGAVMAPPVLPDDLAQDDFYAQVFMARKGQGGVIGGGGGGAGPSGGAGSHALPASPYRNPDGSPKLPDGTLGRIAASSLRKPKKLMSLTGGSALAASPVAGAGAGAEAKGEPAVAAAAADKQKEEAAAAEAESGPARQFMFGRMSLTYLVEEAIRCLMNVEDVDSVLAAFGGPQPQRFEDPRRTYERRRLLAQRETLSLRLAEALDISDPSVPMDADHLILKFATVPKGRLLIFRSLLLLPPPQNFQIVNILMHNLSALAFPESKAAVDSKLSHVLCDALYAMPLAQLNQAFHLFISPRNASNISALLRTKLGCMCAQVLMKRGNNLSVQLQHAQQAMAAHMQASAQAAAQAHAHAQAAAAAAGQPPPPLPPQPRVNPALAAQLQQMQAAHAQWRQLFDYFGANVLPGKLAPLFAAPLKREAKAADAKADAKAAPGAGAGAGAGERGGVMQMPVAVPVQAGGAAKEDAKELAAAAAAAAVEYTTIGGLWELIAAVMSHVRKEQRNAFVAEFRALLSDEIDYITQKIAETRPTNAAPNAQVPAPAPTLQLPPALLYLQSVATATAAAAAAGPAPAAGAAPAQTQAASGPAPAAAAAAAAAAASK